MADETSIPDGAGSPEGVFGNLPSGRPGSRSPRRRSAGKDDETVAATEDPAAPEPEVPPAPAPKAEAEAPAPPLEAEPGPPPQPQAPGIHGVEDLAWAGVAAAAQAATAGVRFASRALDAARKSIDKP